jgi:hypothetical protein
VSEDFEPEPEQKKLEKEVYVPRSSRRSSEKKEKTAEVEVEQVSEDE